MRRFIKTLIDVTLVDLVAYIRRRLPPAPGVTVHQPLVVAETLRRAVVDSADFAEAHMRSALCFAEIRPLWDYAFSQRSISGLIAEFGVWKATSTNYFAALTKETIHGFDSFEGLQEDWSGWGFAKGHFSLGGALPPVAPNVRLIKGWFDQTLPGFLLANPGPFSFLHIDCDTYEATSTILGLAADRIVPGTVILFDEYFGYRGWRDGEFKAWREFATRGDRRFEYKAFGNEAVVLIVR